VFRPKRETKKKHNSKACIKLHAQLSFSFGIGGKGNHVDRYETGRSALDDDCCQHTIFPHLGINHIPTFSLLLLHEMKKI
jgi:hypothetical protein